MSRFSFLRSDRQEAASGKSKPDLNADAVFIADAASGKRNSRKKDAADPSLPEKKRARRRLVGAVTLTLSAIIALPMVLDPEPKPVSQDVAIDISSRNQSTQALIKEHNPVKSPTSAAPAPSVEPAVQAAPVVVAAAAAGAAVVASDKARAATPESAKPPVKPSDSSTQQAAKATSDRKTRANTENRAGEAKAAAASQQGKFMIQVAALATQKGVNELQSKLKAAGIKSHTQKVATQSGERIRVRIGPLANQREADGICAKLVKIRLQCTLIGT